MATEKDGGVRADKPVSKPKAVTVANASNQPVEVRVRGRWVRWEPKGRPGDSQELSVEEAASSEMAAMGRFLARRG